MTLKIINVAAFVLMVVMNYLANALPINNKTTGELSAEYPNLFVPAGITFSIWGVIYLLLLGFVVLQFREQHKPLVAAIGWAFAISCLLNASWILAWHYQHLFLSLLIMAGLLVSLLYINQAIKAFPSGLAHIAFGIYLGWICIATIANATALLVAVQWGGWGIADQAWAIIMIAAGLLITSLAMFRLENPFAGLAVIWALIGIYINRQADFPAVAGTALAAMALMVFLTGLAFYRRLVTT